MLRLTGRLADGWVPSLFWAPPERLPGLHEQIDAGADEAGREPREIQRIYNLSGDIGDRRRRHPARPTKEVGRIPLRLRARARMDTFIFWPSGDHERQVSLFATEVVPGVRQAVSRARS
jgi:alkanesulfonate monooxygenase SsuD/methylene tetrahydromethanopterin reductase-like flavin-dependent oxidoreductase (luciferase family)